MNYNSGKKSKNNYCIMFEVVLYYLLFDIY